MSPARNDGLGRVDLVLVQEGAVFAIFDDRDLGVLGVIGRDDLGYTVLDIPAVVIGGALQAVQAGEELIGVKGDRAADVDQVVLSFLQAFFGHQFLLIQLLTRAQAGVLDLDVHIGLESGKADQIAGQGINFHGTAHVEDEDFAAVGIGACLHDETYGLGHGHEIADDIGVRDRNRSTLGNLLFEDRHYRTVAAQHVAEADSDKFGPDICKMDTVFFFLCDFIPEMSKELGDVGCLSGFDLLIKGLDDHLAQALAGTHDVGGVHGLVGGDQHKALTAVRHGGIGGFIGADGVVLDGLVGAVLHKGDVFMGCGVIDDLRAVFLEDLEHPSAVADRTDEGHQVQLGMRFFQLILDVIGVVLVDIENDELFGVVIGDLPTELRADGTAAARDQDDLAADEVKDLLHLRLDGLAPQQVLDRDGFQLVDGDLTADQLVETGQILEFAVGLLADIQDISAFFCGGAGEGQIDFVDLVLFDILQDGIPAAHNRDIMDIAAPFVGIVVNDADDLFAGIGGVGNIAEDHLPGVAGTDEHDVVAASDSVGTELAQIEKQAVGKPDGRYKNILEARADDVIRDGHAPEQGRDQDNMEDGGRE